MGYPRATVNIGRYSVEMMVLPFGTYRREIVREGESRVFALVHGRLAIRYQGRDRPPIPLTATPACPVILASPGSYHVTATAHTVGVMGVRRV